MPKPNDKHIDPIIAAAMIEDEDETPEEKAMREEIIASQTGEEPEQDEDEKDEDQEDDGDEPEKPEDKSEDEPEDEDEGEEPEPKKPVEAKDDPEDEDDEEEDPEPKKSRKERRQDRNEDFITSIRKDNAVDDTSDQLPQYNPINYEDEDKEFKPEELKEDREKYAQTASARSASQAKYVAKQQNFWKDLDSESKILGYDPELSFLNETKPDGKKNNNFNADKTSEINEMYLNLVGYKQHPKRNEQGQVLVDNQGKPIVSHMTVERTDLSYEKFARKYVKNMSNWAAEAAEDKVDEIAKNLKGQKKRQGVRPNGGGRKSLGALNLGDMSNMSDDDFDKNEDEIDRQINTMLGI